MIWNVIVRTNSLKSDIAKNPNHNKPKQTKKPTQLQFFLFSNAMLNNIAAAASGEAKISL